MRVVSASYSTRGVHIHQSPLDALNSAIYQAYGLLASGNEKVQDNAVRDGLANAVNEAKAVRDEHSSADRDA